MDPVFQPSHGYLRPPPLCISPPRAEPAPALAPSSFRNREDACPRASLPRTQPCSLLIPQALQLPVTARDPPTTRGTCESEAGEGLGD